MSGGGKPVCRLELWLARSALLPVRQGPSCDGNRLPLPPGRAGAVAGRPGDYRLPFRCEARTGGWEVQSTAATVRNRRPEAWCENAAVARAVRIVGEPV